MTDTCGQVVYILDQVRALEAELDARLAAAGLRGAHADVVVVTRLIPESQGTTCHERLERINGTAHARILRTPFRDAEGRVGRRGQREHRDGAAELTAGSASKLARARARPIFGTHVWRKSAVLEQPHLGSQHD